MEKQVKSKLSGSASKRLVEPWSSVAEVAEHLGVKRDTVYKWLERGRIPAHKVGRLWKFRLSEVDSWIMTGTSAVNSKEVGN
jgi:excisionase family DNA binding protein